MSRGSAHTDELARGMCRESDAAGGPVAWLSHLLVVLVVAGGVAWTLLAVTDLHEASVRCESELLEFRSWTRTAARSSRRGAARTASELQRRIDAQSWHDRLPGVRPRVFQTPVGLRVRFAATVPRLEDRRR